MQATYFFQKRILSPFRTVLAVFMITAGAAACTAGDKGDETVADSVSNEPVGNQNPSSAGEAGPSLPADTAAVGNEPKPGAN